MVKLFDSEWTWRVMGALLGVVFCLAVVFAAGVLLSLPAPHGVREYPSSTTDFEDGA